MTRILKVSSDVKHGKFQKKLQKEKNTTGKRHKRGVRLVSREKEREREKSASVRITLIESPSSPEIALSISKQFTAYKEGLRPVPSNPVNTIHRIHNL
jgi:hypothetical protein